MSLVNIYLYYKNMEKIYWSRSGLVVRAVGSDSWGPWFESGFAREHKIGYASLSIFPRWVVEIWIRKHSPLPKNHWYSLIGVSRTRLFVYLIQYFVPHFISRSLYYIISLLHVPHTLFMYIIYPPEHRKLHSGTVAYRPDSTVNVSYYSLPVGNQVAFV